MYVAPLDGGSGSSTSCMQVSGQCGVGTAAADHSNQKSSYET